MKFNLFDILKQFLYRNFFALNTPDKKHANRNRGKIQQYILIRKQHHLFFFAKPHCLGQTKCLTKQSELLTSLYNNYIFTIQILSKKIIFLIRQDRTNVMCIPTFLLIKFTYVMYVSTFLLVKYAYGICACSIVIKYGYCGKLCLPLIYL